MKLILTGFLFLFLFSSALLCQNEISKQQPGFQIISNNKKDKGADSVLTNDQATLKQDSKSPFALSVRSGLARVASKNELYSYRVYKGNNIFYSLSASLNYEFISHKFSAYYTHINRISLDKKLESGLHLVNFSYDLMYKAYTKDNVNIFALLNSSTSANITRYTNVTELVISSFAPGVYLEYNALPVIFGCRLSLPVLSLAYRDNYSISRMSSLEEYHFSDTDSPRFESFKNMFILEFSLGGKVNLNEDFTLGMSYDFKYMKYSYPRTLELVNPSYSIELTRSF